MTQEYPPYHWVPGGSGCEGCCFRRYPGVRCSMIPCQKHPGEVAQFLSVDPGNGSDTWAISKESRRDNPACAR